MRYFFIRRKQQYEEEMYRTYVTEGLYILTNTGLRLGVKYMDIIRPDHKVIDEERSPEEIIKSISDKLERLGK